MAPVRSRNSASSSRRRPLSSTSSLSSAQRLNAALQSPRSSLSNHSVATSQHTINSSNHGRLRRGQRRIAKHQLRKALKHGERIPLSGTGERCTVAKYRYRDLVFVYNEVTRREITSYVASLDKLAYRDITVQQKQTHDQARAAIQTDPSQCTSHSVLLVDTSGSMKTEDVHGCKSRFAAVFLALAEDFVRQRIESGEGGPRDVISVMLMGETPVLWMDAWPTTWTTYNMLLRVLKEGIVVPKGHSYYQPSLQAAETLLQKYDSSSCKLMLAILSDGRPSDHNSLRVSWDGAQTSIASSMESLASKLGSRLTLRTIGIGSANQFATLQNLCKVARDFGCGAELELPSMSASGLGGALSSIATSMTDSNIEGPAKKIRSLVREKRSQVPLLTEFVDQTEFEIYMGDDKVMRKQFESSSQDSFCITTFQHHEACGVAMRKQPFAEGSERFAYQFFEIASDGQTVLGHPLVAKESKFVKEHSFDVDETVKFVARFCRLQRQASKIAKAFNSKLDSIPKLDPDTPRVEFLPCSIYQLKAAQSSMGSFSAVIVEPRLLGNFQKWNSNNGWTMSKSPRKQSKRALASLVPIKEESEEDMGVKVEPDENVSGNVGFNNTDGTSAENAMDLTNDDYQVVTDLTLDDDDEEDQLFVTKDEVAQAFSHFSYVSERRSMLICDLQGAYDPQQKKLRFTDPVIHHHDVDENHQAKYGRTDRGVKGIEDFLNTHQCNGLCNLVTKGFFPVKPAQDFEK